MVNLTRSSLAVLLIAAMAAAALAADPSPEEKAWNILEAAVREKSIPRRHDSILALGLLAGNSRAVGLAETGLDDHAPEVRAASATTLGELHSIASIPKLQLALKDKDISVVLAAAHSLWALRDKQGYEIYYEILVGERKGGPGLIAGQEERFKDPKKLAEFGFEQGIGFSIFTSIGWQVFKVIHTNDLAPVRAAAAKVLADDPDPRSAEALVKSCSDKSWIVRVAALDALARRGDPAYLDEIDSHTSDEKDLVRYTAAAGVIRLSGIPVPERSKGDRASLPSRE